MDKDLVLKFGEPFPSVNMKEINRGLNNSLIAFGQALFKRLDGCGVRIGNPIPEIPEKTAAGNYIFTFFIGTVPKEVKDYRKKFVCTISPKGNVKHQIFFFDKHEWKAIGEKETSKFIPIESSTMEFLKRVGYCI